MSLASPLEQQMLDLINQERANANLAPLTFNNDLNEASEDHSSWMLDTDTFSHTGQGDSSAGDRIVAAGYQLEGNWTWGENIGWQSERGAPGLEDDVADIHQSLMNSPGHRANILNPDFEEIGIGIEQGDFENFDSVMITQNFGATDAIADDPEEEEQPPVIDDPEEEEPPVSEGPDEETPEEEEPPVAEGPDEETPEEEEPPVAEGPDEETPEEEEPPVAEGPDEETPEEEEPPVAEGPDEETPEEEPPVAEGPDEETPEEEEPPVAEGPDEETPEEEEPPIAEGPDDGFDVEQFLADLGDLLNELIDSFEFIASNDCDIIDMEPEMPIIDDMPMDDMPVVDDDSSSDDDVYYDDMDIACDDWGADGFDFNVSINLTFNFDLA